MNTDIIGLQEIKALPDQLPQHVRPPEGYHAFWFPAQKKGYSGTAVFSRKEPLNVITVLVRNALTARDGF